MRLASESKPSEAMQTNGFPPTVPRSSGRSTPSESTRHAAGMSSRGMPTTRQKSLPRPPGRTPSTAFGRSRRMPATQPMSPSPESVTTVRPSSTAARASPRACSSDAVCSVWKSSPRSRSAASTSGTSRPARPPPALGLTSRAIRRSDTTAPEASGQRDYAARLMRRILPLIALLALAGCGSSDDSKTTSTETSEAAQQSTTSGCKKVAKPRPKPDGELDRPSLKPGSARRATIVTNCGTIVISLDVSEQPKTVASFAYLARRGFFDDLTFHRIAQSPDGSDFVVQGGDPTGTGQGGPGYSVTERPPEDAQYTHGVVAMAKTEVEPPGTSGSQFFIVTAEDAGLPPDYAILGKVVSGDDAVKRMAATPADPRTQQPTSPVVMQKVTVSGS